MKKYLFIKLLSSFVGLSAMEATRQDVGPASKYFNNIIAQLREQLEDVKKKVELCHAEWGIESNKLCKQIEDLEGSYREVTAAFEKKAAAFEKKSAAFKREKTLAKGEKARIVKQIEKIEAEKEEQINKAGDVRADLREREQELKRQLMNRVFQESRDALSALGPNPDFAAVEDLLDAMYEKLKFIYSDDIEMPKPWKQIRIAVELDKPTMLKWLEHKLSEPEARQRMIDEVIFNQTRQIFYRWTWAKMVILLLDAGIDQNAMPVDRTCWNPKDCEISYQGGPVEPLIKMAACVDDNGELLKSVIRHGATRESIREAYFGKLFQGRPCSGIIDAFEAALRSKEK